jgi:hypothetical protein
VIIQMDGLGFFPFPSQIYNAQYLLDIIDFIAFKLQKVMTWLGQNDKIDKGISSW